jgi:hypothetical protein
MWSERILAAIDSGNEYKYWVKHYDGPSEYGIGGNGKISKLTIRKAGENRDLYSYERGDNVPAANPEVETILNIILAKYN